MRPLSFKDHLTDIVKGAAGAFLMAGALALLQYLGAAIPELIHWLTEGGAATMAIKAMRFRV